MLPYAFVWEKPLKIFFSKTENALWLNLCIYHRKWEVYQSCENNGRTLTFDLFRIRAILLPYAFVWEKCSEFQTTSPLEPLGQFCSNFIWSLLREWKFAKMVAVRWPRWTPCPYMVKTFKNLLLQNLGCLGAESLLKSYFPATVLFTCIKSWFFRNLLANFPQILHWSYCCDDRIGKMLHNICISAVVMSLRWASRDPWASCSTLRTYRKSFFTLSI